MDIASQGHVLCIKTLNLALPISILNLLDALRFK